MKNGMIGVVGGGLSGLTAARYLSEAGFNVTLFEQGRPYDERDPRCGRDLLTGVGGAGALGGGKLCFPPASGALWAKTRDRMNEFPAFRAETFGEGANRATPVGLFPVHAASSSLQQKTYDTELLFRADMRDFVLDLANRVETEGATIRCGCVVKEVEAGTEGVRATFLNEVGELESLLFAKLILASGRSSTELIDALFGNLQYFPDLGLRLALPTARAPLFQEGVDVKIKGRIGDYLVRTFCVCAGGAGARINLSGLTAYDGHFGSAPSNTLNLGIVGRSVVPGTANTALDYLRAMQPFASEVLSLLEFKRRLPAIIETAGYGELFRALMAFIDRLYSCGLFDADADEVRVRLPAADHLNAEIVTDSSFATELPNLYAIGDAAGVSRGFVQAMWSGRCCARGIISESLERRTSNVV